MKTCKQFTAILFGIMLTTSAMALDLTATYQLHPTHGSIDGSTINVDAEYITAFPAPGDMMDAGFRTDDGKFAMKMFHYGSGWGFFDILPRPDSFEIIENNGSSIPHYNGWVIFSADARHSTIMAKWNNVPSSLTYYCDDFCLVSTLGDPIGVAVDSDGDGVLDSNDLCADTAAGSAVDADGCSGVQHIANTCPTSNSYKNHGKYVSCVAKAAESALDSGLLTEEEKDAIVSEAGESDIGKKSRR